MRVVSISKTLGSAEFLWPKIVEADTSRTPMNIEEMPADVIRVVDHALKILYWQDNLSQKEMPPVWMWHLDHELDKWFTKIKNEREAGRTDASTSDTPEELEHEENLYFQRKRDELRGIK